jgi:pyruvate,orthophosphate dikinase
MDVRELIRQVSLEEPLNPYQVAGMASVILNSGVRYSEAAILRVEALNTVLMVLDRTGEEASPYLIDLRQTDSEITIFPRFPREALDELVFLTGFKGRREAIRENLVPVLYEIPNWLDLVRTMLRYYLERDDESLGEHLPRVMEILTGFLFAATRQPFDEAARAEGEYAVARLVESILKNASDEVLPLYLPYAQSCLEFLGRELFAESLNSFERRILAIFGIRSALKKRSEETRARLSPLLDEMAARALITALGEIRPCPADPIAKLRGLIREESSDVRERFEKEILDRIERHSEAEVERRRETYRRILTREILADDAVIRQGIDFIRGFGDEWRDILTSFQEMVESLSPAVQDAFCDILARQILEVAKPEVKRLLIEGVCEIVVRLEKNRKKASRNLVDRFTELFLDNAYRSADTAEVISSLKALESLGVTLGAHGYRLMAQEFINHIVARPLIAPQEKKYTIEDDDTGEPLVIAEDAAANRAHVRHIKSLLSIIVSNPRIMRRLIPYLIVQMELGGAFLCDEDLVQSRISALLRANSPITHFMVRTLIKATPYSFKDIGPLDTLRLTAAGLAKELANRGVKPIGNFLGKLRGDIHWQGSIENFYFCEGIIRYLSSGMPDAIAEWMPAESLPYLQMEEWCTKEEADGIQTLLGRIFEEQGVDPSEKDGLKPLLFTETETYRNDESLPEFSRRLVTDLVDLLRGLHEKYFIVTRPASGATVEDDLDRLERIIGERRELVDDFLTPDISDPMPAPVTLTEGSEDHVREVERINREEPGTPIVLRAKKAGHAYAQKATYLEERFEAFNKDLRLEAVHETVAASISNTRFEEITQDNLAQALRFLDLLVKGLAVNGHSSYYLDQAGKDLRNAGALALTFDKVRDLLKVTKKELDDVHDVYRYWFEEPFDRRLAFCDVNQLPRKLRDLTTLKEIPDTDFFTNYLKTLYISDLQARDGNLRVLEGFVDKVELFLNRRLAASGRKVPAGRDQVADGDPIYFPEQGEVSACKIGLKACLLRFAEETPPYFVITTVLSVQERETTLSDPVFRERLAASVEELETRCKRSFGDPSNPALFSVRSGSRMSMPGMMTTITNVGINDEIAARMADLVSPWFAYDCYRRFLQEFGQSVFGVEREEFQDIIDERKTRWRVGVKAKMSGDQMKQLAFDYKNRLGELAPDATRLLDENRFLDILAHCVTAVLHSYEGRAARKFREAAGIDGNWRTPAIVQSMAYGNIDFESSGTGVVSYNPFTMELRGDFAHGDQGTDVVGGKVATIPTYDLWKRTETLASRMPESWKQLSSRLIRAAERLHFHVNMEYTIERGNVYILQIRKNRERSEFVPSLESSGFRVIARGTGISGKIFRGIMVTNRNQIAPFKHITKARSIIEAMNRSLREGEKLDGFIFVVNDPIPEEIMEEIFSLPVETALVSRLGGRGAHAADISKSLGKVYVGQVRPLVRFSGAAESVRFNDVDVIVGSKMIIHGQTGEIALYGKSSTEDTGAR